jgi:hypothetical protein
VADESNLDAFRESLISALADIQVQIAALRAAVQKLSTKTQIDFNEPFLVRAKHHQAEFLAEYQKKIPPPSSPE